MEEENDILLVTEKQNLDFSLRYIMQGRANIKEIVIVPDWVIQAIKSGRIK